MKLSVKIILLTCLFVSTIHAQNCVIPISIVPCEQTIDLPESAESNFANILRRAANKNGIVADDNYNQFAITAKIDELSKNILATSPTKISRTVGINLYFVDQYDQKIFESEYIEIGGAGNNETKSWINTLNQINSNNTLIQRFLQSGKNKILNYYNSNYQNITKQAKAALAQQNYGKALSLMNSIPPCCDHYDEACVLGEKMYNESVDFIDQLTLAKAQAIWAAGQDSNAAADALFLISSLNPKSSSYANGQKLLSEIKSQIRSDIDFEMREKYKDEIALRKQTVEAWRAVGVAYGNGQKPTTTFINWIK